LVAVGGRGVNVNVGSGVSVNATVAVGRGIGVSLGSDGWNGVGVGLEFGSTVTRLIGAGGGSVTGAGVAQEENNVEIKMQNAIRSDEAAARGRDISIHVLEIMENEV